MNDQQNIVVVAAKVASVWGTVALAHMVQFAQLIAAIAAIIYTVLMIYVQCRKLGWIGKKRLPDSGPMPLE